jgi:hypothetical protein
MYTLQFVTLSFMVSLLILDCSFAENAEGVLLNIDLLLVNVIIHTVGRGQKTASGLLPVAVAVETYSFKIKNHGLLWVRPWPKI